MNPPHGTAKWCRAEIKKTHHRISGGEFEGLIALVQRKGLKEGVMDKTGAFFETWDSNGQNGCF